MSRTSRGLTVGAIAAILTALPGCLTLHTIDAVWAPAGAPRSSSRIVPVSDAAARRIVGGFHVELTYADGSRRAWDLLRPEPPLEELLAPAGAENALGEQLIELAGAPEPAPPRVTPCVGAAHAPSGEPLPRAVQPSAGFTGLQWGPGWGRAVVFERGRAVGGGIGVDVTAAVEVPGERGHVDVVRLVSLPLALAIDLAFLPINLYLGLLELRDALR